MDPKGLLPPFMQTKKEGGSSLTHPLAEMHQGDGQAARRQGDENESYGTETGAMAGSNAQEDQYRQEPGAGEQRELGEQREMGSGRGAEDIASARQDYVEDREATQQREMDSRGGMGGMGGMESRELNARQGATGLEQRDGYAAAAQAGGLLDKEDIRNIDREVEAGSGAGMMSGSSGAPRLVGNPESGFNASMPGSTGGMTGSTEPYTSTGMGSTGTTGTLSGEEPVSGQEGLIHGHHNTLAGEVLDPHLKR